MPRPAWRSPRSVLPVGQLPDTFDVDTTVLLAGDPWSIEPVLREFGLLLVDWCRCAVVEPDGLADYAATL